MRTPLSRLAPVLARLAPVLALLLALAPSTAAAGAALPAAGPGPPRLLAVEPLGVAADEPLVPRLVDRLQAVGPYAAALAPGGEILAAIARQPTTLGLMRRSSLSLEQLGQAGATFIEVGPAACLVLAVAPMAPWRSYAELSYLRPARGLEVQAVGAAGAAALARLQAQLPLGGGVLHHSAPSLRLGAQLLLNGEIDLLAFEVVRRGQSATPPAALLEVLERGVRLLELPTHLLGSGADAASIGAVPLEEQRFWRQAAGYPTVCDPFVLVFATAFAEELLGGLQPSQAGPGQAGAGEAAAPDLPGEIGAALRSLVTMLRARF